MIERNLFLSAGHSTKPESDNGAVGNGLIEGIVAAEFRLLLFTELKSIGVHAFVDGDHTVLSDTIGWIKRFVGKDSVAIDIHVDSATPHATGCTVFIPDVSSVYERTTADAIANCVSKSLSIRNRGVKPESLSARKKLAWMSANCENILIELFFISNKYDCEEYQKNKHKLARNLALVLKDKIIKL